MPGIKKPILILGADGNTNQCVISGIIREEGEDDMEDGESDYNFNGVKRVLMLAKVDGIPETYANVKILLDSLIMAVRTQFLVQNILVENHKGVLLHIVRNSI